MPDKPIVISQRALFWMGAFLALVFFLWMFRSILLPFVAGAALAYLLDPVADWLERRGFSRLWATITILIAFSLFFLLALIIIIPVLVTQMANFAQYLPGAIQSLRDLVLNSENPFIQRIVGESQKAMEGFSTDLIGEITAVGTSFLKGIISSSRAVVDGVSLLIVAPVVAFYLLYDWDRMVKRLDDLLPRDNAPAVRNIMNDVNGAIAGFIRGQGSLCLILGTFYAIALSLIGLNFGLLIGMFAGLISFIPFVGSIVGLLLSVGVAIVQFWPEYWWVLATAAIFFIGQFLEGNILQPKLIGDSVGLHPVWLMFALFAFGSLMGFTGMLIAVPVAASIGVVVRYGVGSYLTSAYYHGGEERPAVVLANLPDEDGSQETDKSA